MSTELKPWNESPFVKDLNITLQVMNRTLRKLEVAAKFEPPGTIVIQITEAATLIQPATKISLVS
jgi:hypothetical protein